MTEALLATSLLGFASSTALAVWLVVMRGDLEEARLALRDARTVANRADARSAELEKVKKIDDATIARLERAARDRAKERNDEAERNAQNDADGGGDAVDSDIRRMYPDAHRDG